VVRLNQAHLTICSRCQSRCYVDAQCVTCGQPKRRRAVQPRSHVPSALGTTTPPTPDSPTTSHEDRVPLRWVIDTIRVGAFLLLALVAFLVVRSVVNR
jgi:hypothetical protein